MFADGAATAQYAGTNDPTADLPGWSAAISAGEPTAQADPLVAQALTQLETYRSPYYLPVPQPAEQVPVFAVSHQPLAAYLYDIVRDANVLNCRMAAGDVVVATGTIGREQDGRTLNLPAVPR